MIAWIRYVLGLMPRGCVLGTCIEPCGFCTDPYKEWAKRR